MLTLKDLVGKRVIIECELENLGELHIAGILEYTKSDNEECFGISVNEAGSESNAYIVFKKDDVYIDTPENKTPVILLN